MIIPMGAPDGVTGNRPALPRNRSCRTHSAHQVHFHLSELAGRVLPAEVRRLEQSYNGGQPFPAVDSVPPGPGPAGVERIRNGGTAPRSRPVR